MSRVRSTISGIVDALCVGYCFKEFIAKPVICDGHSMEPTIRGEDIVVLDQVSLRLKSYDEDYLRNKVVIFRDPRDPMTLLCKRVKWTSSDSGFFNHIPRGMVYVQGDNSGNSTDSRSFGPIPIGLIQGVVCYKVQVYMRRE